MNSSPNRSSASFPSWAIYLLFIGCLLAWDITKHIRATADKNQRQANMERELNAMLAELKTPEGEAMTQEAWVEKFCQAVARNATGEDQASKGYRALASYFRKVARQEAAADQLCEQLGEEALNIATLKTKADLVSRRTLAEKYVVLLRSAAAGEEQLLRSELEREHVSAEAIHQCVTGFFSDKDDPSDRARELKLTMGQSIIELCDLAEAEWGKWRLNATTQEIEFDNEAAVAKYEAVIKRYDAVEEVRTKMVEELTRR